MYEQQSLLTADLDEIIDATGHNDAQPQEQAQKAPAVKYYPIDEETARRAHEMMSMRDYPAGRATNEYRASVDKAAAQGKGQKGRKYVCSGIQAASYRP